MFQLRRGGRLSKKLQETQAFRAGCDLQGHSGWGRSECWPLTLLCMHALWHSCDRTQHEVWPGWRDIEMASRPIRDELHRMRAASSSAKDASECGRVSRKVSQRMYTAQQTAHFPQRCCPPLQGSWAQYHAAILAGMSSRQSGCMMACSWQQPTRHALQDGQDALGGCRHQERHQACRKDIPALWQSPRRPTDRPW